MIFAAELSIEIKKKIQVIVYYLAGYTKLKI
jgi:hypothetical protein